MRASPRLQRLTTRSSGCALLVCTLATQTSSAQSNHQVVCWGLNDARQCQVPSSLGECVAIAGGGAHTLALTVTGVVVCWGSDEFGQSTPPTALASCMAIACGLDHSLAVRSDGTVASWGRNESGQCSVPSGLIATASIAGGNEHSLALELTGAVRGWGANSLGQITIPPLLGPCTQVAAGGFHSVALRINGSVVAWGRNTQSVSVVGSPKARDFMFDAKNGIDSVDILLCGDSNTGFNTSLTSASIDGWTDGLAIGVRALGVKEFATPLLPVSNVGSPLGVGSFQSAMRIGFGSTSGSAQAQLVSGVLNAPSDLVTLLAPSHTPSVSGLHTVGSPFDFGWVPAQPNTFFSDTSGVYITPWSALDLSSELIYRVLRTAMPLSQQPGGYFQSWREAQGSVLVPPTARSCAAPQSGWVADELELPADPTRGATTVHADCGGNFSQGTGGATGNIGFGLQSVYRRVRGYATQPLEFRGGATMTTIARDVAQMPLASRMTWLGELRSRQIAAGGTGRLIVFVQGGINRDAGEPESWGAAVVSIKSALEEAWIALGASLDTITFLAMVSHPTTSFDGQLGAIREFANQMPTTLANVTIVDLSKLTSFEEMQSKQWYSEQPAHLSESGYSSLAIRIVRDLTGQSGACDVPLECSGAGSCTAIAAGGGHTVALTPNGKILAWGSPLNGQCDPVNPHVMFTHIAAGSNHTVALRQSGEISAWGSTGFGECDPPANLHHGQLIAAGGSHTIAFAEPLAPCLGDTNFDWVVNSQDLTAVLSGWGSGNIGDVTGDGLTDGQDLSAIFSGWGNCY